MCHLSLEVKQGLVAVPAMQAHRNRRGAGLKKNSCTVTVPGTSKGEKSSCFFNAEGRIVPQGFLKE